METRMVDRAVWGVLFFVTLFELIPKTRLSVQGNTHAYAQADSDVRYLADGLPVTMHKDLSGVSVVRVPGLDERSIYSSKSHLKFEPPLLDFKQRHLGIPHHEKVTLFNVNSNKTIHMSSISGNTVHFHSSFFEDKTIPPLGNTSFNVVFLGREEGEIESNLFIHTSEGSFKYQVKGASISSPYRLRPLVGVKIPINATYSPLIYMHNPHNTLLQLTEVYSSGGDFHLELPSGEMEGPKHLWEIPPFNTKAIIRIRFVARAEKNHTAYVRIKLNKTDEILVVPLEVEVGAQAGIYSPDDLIDFGIGGRKDKPKTLPLYLLNSGKKVIRIQSVTTASPSEAVKIEFQPVKVPPESKVPTKVAVLTFDWKAAFENKDYNGRIVIKSKQDVYHDLVIPYVAQVLDGGLDFNASVTQYCLDVGERSSIRNFTVRNTFSVPIALINITLHKEAQAHFMVHHFTPTILAPGKTAILFQLILRKDSLQNNLMLDTNLMIHTNISTVKVPLLCYNGKLIKVILNGQNESGLNFGTVGSTSHRETHFALLNNNPVAVNLDTWGTNLTGASVELIGVEEGNISTILKKHDFINMNKTSVLQPGFFAVFRVLVIAPEMEGTIEAEVFVNTHFEKVVVPAKMRVAHGKLEVLPDPVVFDDCFPGKLCVQQLHVRSLFSRAMVVTSITSVPPDPRIQYIPPELIGGPARVTELLTSPLGELHFEPGLRCGIIKCYTGIPHNSPEGKQWLQSLALPFHCQDSDLSQLNSRYSHYLGLTRDYLAYRNLTFRLDTTEVRGHIFHAKVHLVWPRIVLSASSKKPTIEFPLTQVGETVYKDLILHNPSIYPVVVQLAMDSTYPQALRMLENISRRFYPRTAEFLDKLLKQFSLEDNSLHLANLEKLLDVHIHPDSLPFLLEPGEKLATKIAFAPTKSAANSAVLFVRNNLTILEVIRISGRATQAQFKFGNRRPGSEEPLMFELSRKHLRDCEREKNRKFPAPNLTVKRSFIARNTGELPVYVRDFSINGLHCEGFGFRVLNCAPFQLEPNGTRKIDIAFTPDFTLAKVHRMLDIDTNLGIPVNYSLIATIPPYFLATCSSVLARPSWEELLYYIANCFMLFLFLCVVAAAYIEAHRILRSVAVNIKQEKVPKSSLDVKLPSSNAGTSTNTHPVQKCSDKSHVGKLNGEWNVNHHREKRNREPHISHHSQSNSNSKSCTWNSFEEKQIGIDMGSKERSASLKYDDVDAGYSTSSTPLLSVRNKKKLTKKNSNNSDASSVSETVHENVGTKKSWCNQYIKLNSVVNQAGKSRLNLAESKAGSNRTTRVPEIAHKSRKCLEVLKENKKSVQATKKSSKVAVEPIVSYEEETSSTTTESSNNEEIDKEKNSPASTEKSHKTSPKKDKGKINDYRDNYEGDCDDDDYERDGHKKKEFSSRWKSNLRTLSKHVSEMPGKSNNDEVPKAANLELPYKPKSSKITNKERKEKNVLRRRAAAERNTIPKVTTVASSSTPTTSSANPAGSSVSPSATVAPLPASKKVCATQPQPPPPPPVTTSVSASVTAPCWGENRASFSDVVARNESPLYSSIVAPRRRVQAPVGTAPASTVEKAALSSASQAVFGAGTSACTNNTVLGPIGSKIQATVWESQVESQKPNHVSRQDLPSLVSDSFADQAQQSDDSLGGMPYTDNSWEQGTEMAFFENKDQKEDSKSSGLNETWPMMDALWKPLYTPPLPVTSANNSLFSDTCAVADNRPQASYAPWASNDAYCAGSVWSSSTWSTGPVGSVPAPLTTPAPILPAITTPVTMDSDVNKNPPASVLERGLGFDPFNSLNAIWIPRSPETWSSQGKK